MNQHEYYGGNNQITLLFYTSLINYLKGEQNDKQTFTLNVSLFFANPKY